jgi:hypothetical protein
MKDKRVLFEWTFPWDDWLVGVEYIPELELTELEWVGSVFSIGILIFRVDFLLHKANEE